MFSQLLLGGGRPQQRRPAITDTMLIATNNRGGPASAGSSMSEPGGFKNVLVGVDGTSTGRDAIALADILRDPDGPVDPHPRRARRGSDLRAL